MISVVRISQWLYFVRWACGSGQLSQVTFRLIGQEWPVFRLITATPDQVRAAQRGTGSVWRAAHDWVCSRWEGEELQCLLHGLFWGQPANRDTFVITCHRFVGTSQIWSVSAPWPSSQHARRSAAWPSKWLEGCNLYGLVRGTAGLKVALSFFHCLFFLSTKATGGNRWR